MLSSLVPKLCAAAGLQLCRKTFNVSTEITLSLRGRSKHSCDDVVVENPQEYDCYHLFTYPLGVGGGGFQRFHAYLELSIPMVKDEYPLLSCIVLRILIPFATSNLCEAGLWTVAVIKIK